MVKPRSDAPALLNPLFAPVTSLADVGLPAQDGAAGHQRHLAIKDACHVIVLQLRKKKGPQHTLRLRQAGPMRIPARSTSAP